ncbi:MAG: hypothetical protein FWE68_04845 [Defluviitaleaceae bacterium]|nr:hypothetical protein [Defluviitaleaceae bacterium]
MSQIVFIHIAPSFSYKNFLFPHPNFKGCDTVSKDSQPDQKEIRAKKAKGGHTVAESAPDGEGRNNKKQSGSRHKPNADK